MRRCWVDGVQILESHSSTKDYQHKYNNTVLVLVVFGSMYFIVT